MFLWNDYIYYYENENNKKRPLDEELIKLYYQILALISEGILSYYTAIEFVENIIFWMFGKNRSDKKTASF